MGGGPPGAAALRSWRDVPMAGPPGQTAPLRIPIWDPGALEALGRGSPAVCRCVVLDPNGYCPVTADVLIVPDVPGPASAPPGH
jgi:hypothetical protein